MPVIVGDSMNLPAGPDVHGYRIYDHTDSCYDRRPEFDWFEIRGLGTEIRLSDDSVASLPLPPEFGPWRYYGRAYDSVSVCSNGWIAPGMTDRRDFVNVQLPYENAPPNIVALVWDDLQPAAYGHVWFHHDPASHRFVVEFDSVPYFGIPEQWEKAQVQVFDSTVSTPTLDNSIVLQFLTVNHYSSATVGLQNQDGSAGLTHTWDSWYPRVSAPLTPGRALRFETVELTGTAEPAVAVATQARLVVNPSVFRTRTSIGFGPAAGTVRLAVYAVDGRKVRVLESGGASSLTWDGTDDKGRKLAPGTYFIQAQHGPGFPAIERTEISKVVRLGP